MKDIDNNYEAVFELESPFVVNEVKVNNDDRLREFQERFESPIMNSYTYEGPFSTTYQSEAGQSIDPQTERYVELKAELERLIIQN